MNISRIFILAAVLVALVVPIAFGQDSATSVIKQQVWLDPIFVTVQDSQGRPHRICVQEGQWKTIDVPCSPAPAAPAPVIAPAGAPSASPIRLFAIQNRQKFQIQIEEVLAVRGDGAATGVVLPHDRAISSLSQLNLEVPPDTVLVTVRFKQFDRNNLRFKHPVLEASFETRAGGAMIF